MANRKFIDFKLAFGLYPEQKRKSYADLVGEESALSRKIFGPVPEGHQREFFASKPNVWMWYESWTDAGGDAQEVSLKYEVRPDGVYKRTLISTIAGVDGRKNPASSYARIEGAELENFTKAVRAYHRLVKAGMYTEIRQTSE